MAVEIRVPMLGDSIVEATIGKWHKKVGDAVTSGDILVELETDKVNVEVRAEQSGMLEQLVKAEGTTVKVGDVLGAIGSANGQPSPAVVAPAAAAPSVPATPEADGRKVAATPVAQKIATANNVDLAAVVGTGPSGRVTRDDVVGQMAPAAPVAAAAPPTPTPAAAPVATPIAPVVLFGGEPPREERVRMSRRRQTIARRLVEAQRTAAMLTTFNEIDMSAVMELRKRRATTFQEKHSVKLGFMSFFVKAVVGALKFQPRLNAEIQGDEVVLKHYYDIGIAVAADEGLVVPVLRGADRLGFAAIEKGIADLGKRARDNSLTIAELQGGSFTITNGGIFGSLMSTPILNAPQVGILGMHAIKERPIAVNGQVAIRPMMYVALSYDHRIVDGSEAVRFLVRVKELIEDPESLLLDS